MLDILVIANDFNDKGIKLLKFSMPTKAPRIHDFGYTSLVYASPETAVSKFFSQNECGYCVTRTRALKKLKKLSGLNF